jgi:alpha-galactosidase
MTLLPPIAHLRRGGTSLVVDLSDGRLPRVLHWGADLGELDAATLGQVRLAVLPHIGDSAVTYPQPVPVVPQLAEGWLGRPGVVGSRGGGAFAPLFATTGWESRDEVDRTVLTVEAVDVASALLLTLWFELTDSGLVRIAAHLANSGDSDYRVDALELVLPVPGIAGELLDLTGRWAAERAPQRHPFEIGQWLRESRGGKPGLDAPTVLVAGEPGFGFRRGAVWGVHLGWSGNQLLAAERTPAGSPGLRGAEILLPDEVVLAPGEGYRTPWLYGSWGMGLDEFSGRFHRYLRARPSHPKSPRPVLVNTWEAVYFDFDPDRLIQLAEASAEIGAERFVVDDGWFLGRRDDTTSLGDWIVDTAVLPDGLEPIAARVHELGMEFGLWFEPEMVNLDSELARAHPEWVFDGGHGVGLPSRQQHVLDLGHDGAYALVLNRISELVGTLGIDYIKWDHNRFLTDAGHTATGRAGARVQTLRAYRMMDELRAAHPGLEIESCASGGGRIDLGVLERTDRVWPSDCNDPHERIDIQRYTGLILPPELQGTHIGAEVSHTTRRHSTLDFRGAVAIWGNLGLEIDLTRADDGTLAGLRAWVELHKRHRDLLHSGTVVHADVAGHVRVEGVVAPDSSSGLFHVAMLGRPIEWPAPRIRLPGLDLDRRYRVSHLDESAPRPPGQSPPWTVEGIELSGRILTDLGLETPLLDPDSSVLLHVVAV